MWGLAISWTCECGYSTAKNINKARELPEHFAGEERIRYRGEQVENLCFGTLLAEVNTLQSASMS